MMLQWFASPEWVNVVKALLHTLWQGALIALLLGVALRRLDHPTARYRCSLAALAGVMLAGLVTWAVLNRPVSQPASNPPDSSRQSTAALATEKNSPALVVNFPPLEAKPAEMNWMAWLALFWLAGATAMTGRAGYQVAGAERLRRSSHPLDDVRIIRLLAEARRAVGLARRVRLAVTEKLTSPAVVGVLVPTLVLPLTLTTTLTPEQIRFVLLHELAHIRRGDYFANLFQLLAEALLFFNPAVWWISRHMRFEREACCDALAVELSGAPSDYVRTLVRVAESVLHPASVAVPAFGDKHEPSSLADRVQRMLVPGYRPTLRLTWRAMLVALFVGCGLLFLSALGTRVTVAAILSPQERIERIEKKMTELGEKPVADINGNDENAPQVKISGQFRTADGTPVPKWVWLNLKSSVKHSSYSTTSSAKNGFFTSSIRAGTIYIGAEIPNFAPALIGPLDGIATNRFENLEIILQRGFDVPLQLVDAENGQPVANANVATMFWMHNNGFQSHLWKSGADGSITLTHCADMPMDVTANVPGYEITRKKFDHVRAGEPLRVELHRGAIVSGVVLDKATGQPVAGAELHLRYQSGMGQFQWDDPLYSLGKTDSSGVFTLNQLRQGVRYYLGVSAPGHASIILDDVPGNGGNLVVRLGPELIVRGHVIGNLDGLQQIDKGHVLNLSTIEKYEDNSYGNSEWVPLHVTNGVVTFQFTNRVAGPLKISAEDHVFERNVDAPVDDWVIDLTRAAAATNPPVLKREVALRFKDSSGNAPKGTVYVIMPDKMDALNPSYYRKEVEVQNGEVRVQTFAGAMLEYEPAHTVGYWFKSETIPAVANGTGPLVIDVPVIPAGAIYARAKNADGTPAAGLLFSVDELKRSPQRDEASPLSDGSDSISDDAPRRWVSGPLPLGGTYQIIGWRGNSFCVGQPVTLTESQPDAEVELQFPPGQSFTGEVLDADGRPARDGEVGVEFSTFSGHGFGLKPVRTDENGRFRVDDTTPGIGKYSLNFNCPGCRAERFEVNFLRLPVKVKLQRGLKISGQVVEAATGYVIPNAEIRAWTESRTLPQQTAHTDADGHFEFTTLGDTVYHLFVDGANFEMDYRNEFAAGRTNVLLKVTPYRGSQLKPKAPVDITGNATGNVATKTYLIHHPIDADNLKKLLLEAGVRTPPSAFFCRDNGILLVHGSMEQQALAYRVVLKLNGFSTSQIEAAENGFLKQTDAMPVAHPADTNLFMRTFKVDAYVFNGASRNIPGLQTNSVSAMARGLFSKLGVDFESPPGKSVFYNDRLGLLFVRATESDLDTIERAIQALNDTAPQIHIKARFVEVPQQGFVWPGADTNMAKGILNTEQAQTIRKMLEAKQGFETLAEPEAVTTSGRQTQMRATIIINVLTNFAFQETWTNGDSVIHTNAIVAQTTNVEIGPVLDTVATALPDGYTIDLKTTASVTSFFGYADPTNLSPRLVTNSAGEKITLPVVLPAVQTRQESARVKLYDGQTLVLSGLQPEQMLFSEPDRERERRVAEHIQQGEAKSKSKMLIVLVTATLVDPAGNRVHTDDEMPSTPTGDPLLAH